MTDKNKNHIKSMVTILNNELPNYNPLTVKDWNKCKNLLKRLTGMSEKLAAQIATDFESYRTNVIGYNILINTITERLKPYRK